MRNGSGRRLTKLNAFTCRPSDPAPRTVPKGHASNDVPRMRERRPGEGDGAHGRLATRWRSPGHGRRAPSGSRSRGARAGAAFFLLKKGKLGKEPHTRDAGHTRAQTPRGTPNPETCEDAEKGAGRPTGGAFLSGDRFVESRLWKHIHALRAREKRYRTDEPQSAPERGTGPRTKAKLPTVEQ